MTIFTRRRKPGMVAPPRHRGRTRRARWSCSAVSLRSSSGDGGVRARTLFALLVACSPGAGPGTLTVGVEGQALGNYLQSLHVVTTVDGRTQTDAVFRASQGAVFPREVKVD